MIGASSYRVAELLTIGPIRFAKKPYFKFKKILFSFFISNSNFFPIYLEKIIDKYNVFLNENKNITIGLLDEKNLNILFNLIHNNAQNALLFKLNINNTLVDFHNDNGILKLENDPISNFVWPSNNVFQNISLSSADIRYPWEFSRLHHILWFAICWKKTENNIWLKAIETHIKSVEESNKFLHGILWQDGLNISIRIINLLLVLEILNDETKIIYKMLTKFLIKNIIALKLQISSDSNITNNHSIGEFVALSIANCVTGKNKCLQASLEKLKKEIKRQYYSDHISYEGSIPYLRFNIDFLLILYIFLERKSKLDLGWLLVIIKEKMGAIYKISDNNAKLPLFGDGDDGRVIKLFDEPYEVIENSAWLAHKITGETFIHHKSAKGISLIFYKNDDLFIKEDKLKEIKYEKGFSGSSGFKFFSINKMELWVDCTPTGLGLNGPGGHGHNDVTSFILNWHGKKIIIDSGWYSYYMKKELRDNLRSSESHNVLKCNGYEQADLLSTFHISSNCKPHVSITKKVLGSNVLKCGHSGFDRIDKSIVYERIFVINKSGSKMRVIDRLSSKTELKVDLFLNAKLKFTGSKKVWKLGSTCKIKLFGNVRTEVLKSVYSEKTGELKKGNRLNVCNTSKKLLNGRYINLIKTDFIFNASQL